MGSFFKAYATKSKKKGPKASCETPKEKQLTTSWVDGGGAVKVQVYAAPLHVEDGAEASRDFLQLQCEVEFDPEKDYAQVLAEARTHLKFAKPLDHNPPTSWLPALSLENHLDAYRELHSTLAKPTKPSKIWRYLLFWQRASSRQRQVEAEIESIFSTPPHPAFKQSHNDTCNDTRKAKGNNMCMSKCFAPAKRGNSGPLGLRPTSKSNSGPLNMGPRATRRNNSGPLYTDGLPSGPYNVRHTKKSYSGPLAPMGSTHLSDHPLSYELLHRPPLCSPLYSC